MSKPLLNLCSVGPVANRDGGVGGTAHIYLPFYGYWYASGQVYPSNSPVQQDMSRLVGGTKMVDNFQKNCCCC